MSSGTTSGIEANPSSLAAAESLGVFEMRDGTSAYGFVAMRTRYCSNNEWCA